MDIPLMLSVQMQFRWRNHACISRRGNSAIEGSRIDFMEIWQRDNIGKKISLFPRAIADITPMQIRVHFAFHLKQCYFQGWIN